MAYFYVLEDDLAALSRAPKWAEDHPLFRVYESDIDSETQTFGPAKLVCGGLNQDQANWFHSFPETRPLLIEQWQHMMKHNTWRAAWRSNERLARFVVKARDQHGSEQSAKPGYLRTELSRMLGQPGGESNISQAPT